MADSPAGLRWKRWALPPARSTSVVIFVGILLYRVLLDFAYGSVVAPSFSYQGFSEVSSTGRWLVSWIFLLSLLPLLVSVLRKEVLSSQIAAMLALISFVPTSVLVAYDPQYTTEYLVLMFVYWLVFLLSCIFMPSIKPFQRPLRSEFPHLVVLVATVATVLFISWQYTGFRLHFGLFDVYDLRAEAREYQIATLLGYFATIADNALPILLAFYFRRRWFLLAFLVALVILVNFGISATKQVIFLLFFAFLSFFVAEPARLNRKILLALLGIILLCVLEELVFGSIFLSTLSIYRVMFLPAHLHWVHFDFFQNNDFLYLTQSALKFFFESPYKENIQFLLGDYFIGQITARANNGLFSDAYMNFGAIGVFCYPILTVFILKLLEGAARGLASSVQFMLVISLSFVFLGLPLPTAVLSAGVGVLVILLSTLPRSPRAGGREVLVGGA